MHLVVFETPSEAIHPQMAVASLAIEVGNNGITTPLGVYSNADLWGYGCSKEVVKEARYFWPIDRKDLRFPVQP